VRKTSIILNPSAGGVRDLDKVVALLGRLPDAEIRPTNKPGSAKTSATHGSD